MTYDEKAIRVAWEPVAAQAPENPGALVLSQFAGAAQELKSALIVNPYDTEATATAIAQAFAMPLEERKERWRDMIAVLRANTIHDWTSRFLAALGRGHEATEDAESLPESVAALALGRPIEAAVGTRP